MKVIEATPVISTLIYAAGDAVGGLLEFPFAGGSDAQGGRIVGAAIIDRAAQDAPLVLQLFDRTFGATADQAPYNPSDADIANAIGNIPWLATDYEGGSGNSVGTRGGLDIAYVPLATSLFGQLFTSGTPTYVAAGDLTVKLFIEES